MAGKAGLVTKTQEELAAGAIAMPHDEAIARNFGVAFGGHAPNSPDEIRKLGKVEAVAYLGEGGLTDILYQRDRETIAWLPPDPEGLGTGLMSGVPAVCNPAMSAV